MKAEIMTITPTFAEKLLSNAMENNRPIQQKKVDQYAKAMREGRWRLNGETIKVFTGGILGDGHHRLWACVESGTPFKTWVVFDVPIDVFPTIDTGVARSAAAVLHMGGHPSSHVSSSAVRWITAIRQGKVFKGSGIGNFHMMQDEVLEAANKLPGLHDSVNFALTCRKVTGFGSLVAAMHYICTTDIDAGLAEEFFTDLRDGAGLDMDNPVYVLRERLRRKAIGRITPAEAYTLIVRAWNAFMDGRTVGKLPATVKSVDEKLPTLKTVANGIKRRA